MAKQKRNTAPTGARNRWLLVLQGKAEGNRAHAAAALARHYQTHYHVKPNNEIYLEDWLVEGDYDGTETIVSILREWRAAGRGEH